VQLGLGLPKAKAVFALALLPKAKAVFALAWLDSGIDDCDCRGKDDVADVRMSKAGSLDGFGNPLTPRGNTLPLLEELTASGAESFGG
jgi:hypothetical protein